MRRRPELPDTVDVHILGHARYCEFKRNGVPTVMSGWGFITGPWFYFCNDNALDWMTVPVQDVETIYWRPNPR